MRWTNYQDTPFPPETPAGQNPPDGAIIDYYLKNAATSELTLTIFDEAGKQMAKFDSNPKPHDAAAGQRAPLLVRASGRLDQGRRGNRFVWDLRYPAPQALPYGYWGTMLDYTEYTLTDHAIPTDTPLRQPMGPLVAPGKYTVELQAGGQTLRQSLTVELDPRVKASRPTWPTSAIWHWTCAWNEVQL